MLRIRVQVEALEASDQNFEVTSNVPIMFLQFGSYTAESLYPPTPLPPPHVSDDYRISHCRESGGGGYGGGGEGYTIRGVFRGSIPAKVGFWVGLRIFSYVSTPTKLTNTILKTQLSGPKKGAFLPKIPRMWPFFCI